jgi:hypothetical protein
MTDKEFAAYLNQHRDEEFERVWVNLREKLSAWPSGIEKHLIKPVFTAGWNKALETLSKVTMEEKDESN